MSHLWIPDLPWWHLVIRAGVIYGAILLLLRFGGKRQVGQMGIADFVALLLISNAVQNSMNGGDNSITGGIILAAVLIALSYLFTYVTFRSARAERILQGRPTLLIHHGRILKDHLNRELLNYRELRVLLRRQGVHDIGDVEEAVLEADGFISITRKSEPKHELEIARNNNS